MAIVKGTDTILKAQGTATGMTTEATTEVTTTIFQITSSSKRVIDPYTAVTVYANAVEQSRADYNINYLEGKITFGSSKTGQTVTISGKYLPLVTISQGRGHTFSVGADFADATYYGDTAVRMERIGLTLEGSIDSLHSMADSFSGQTINALADKTWTSGQVVYIESLLDGASKKLRAFVNIVSVDGQSDVKDVHATNLKYKGVVCVPTGTGVPQADQGLWTIS